MGSVLGAIEGGEVETLLVVGFDPDSVLPRSLWSRWGKVCDTVIWAGSLESDFGEQADIVLPLALAWEESGHKASPQGTLEEYACWTAPPSGVLAVQELMARLGGTPVALSGLSAPLATEIKLEAFVTKAVFDAAGPGKGEAWLVAAPETYGYTGGLSCFSVSWQQRMATEEKACLSPALAAEVGVEGAWAVKLSAAAPGGGDSHTSFPFRLAEERFYRKEKVVTMPAHWKALRELLAWRLDGKWAPQAAPAIVRVERGD